MFDTFITHEIPQISWKGSEDLALLIVSIAELWVASACVAGVRSTEDGWKEKLDEGRHGLG